METYIYAIAVKSITVGNLWKVMFREIGSTRNSSKSTFGGVIIHP